MSDFRKLSGEVWASPQIDVADVAEAARLGFAMIVNNRPDGEAEGQPEGGAIARAAHELGLAYRAIPISHAGFSAVQIGEMRAALEEAQGPVLAYCRSGTRSTLLWGLAQAQAGHEPEAISEAAGAAGYDLAPIRAAMEDMLANGTRS